MSQRTLRRLERRFVRAILRRGRQRRPAFRVNIEPTNHCNLRCPICVHARHEACQTRMNRAKGYMELSLFESLVTDPHRCFTSIALYLHGEPFLHPQLPEMVAMATESGCRVSLFSNGLAFDETSLRRCLDAGPASLSLSMDLISRESYRRFKGFDRYDDATEKLKLATRLSTAGKRTRITLRAIYGGESRPELEAFFARWVDQRGLDSIQLTHPFPWPGNSDPDVLANRIDEDNYRDCPEVWSALNVFWDGRVSACSADYNAECIIGDVQEQPLDKIVNSAQARRFRRKHILGKRSEYELCGRCLLPNFRTSVITVDTKQYSKLEAYGRDRIISDIESLHYRQAKEG